MADAQTFEKGGTLALLNKGPKMMYVNRSSEKIHAECKTTTWCLHEIYI
jgi:hypothetical protein